MGNLIATCCGNKSENNKPGLLDESTLSTYNEHQQTDDTNDGTGNKNKSLGSKSGSNDKHLHSSSNENDEILQRQQEAERQRAYQYEQARLEMIVSEAGRDMVTIGRRDGYFDQAYAAGVAQSLRKSGVFMGMTHLDGLEKEGVKGGVEDVVEVLSRPGRELIGGEEVGMFL
eukprot:CAMPEP_0172501040 /NCGR_PEP_ID=MMETSP1066-20121228/145475_1 /TAXON_ID=671091 /ORGANISM="Coscinodiscus wailesii, Strain CCMP2513" /LENGTH=171 /DNA_ID=CAMNT_0013275617 /DNA_START=119 /DNA_END=631 /DNA_ORIENTATION=-